MFQKDDLVVYGSTGVCRVKEIGSPENLPAAHQAKLYYTLKPLFSGETIYTPVDTAVFMRPVITDTDANRLIDLIPSIRADAFDAENVHALAEHYEIAIKTHNCEDLIELTMSIYAKKQHRLLTGKKCSQVDERFMKKAEDLLFGEFSVALGIPREEVQTYISDRAEAAS